MGWLDRNMGWIFLVSFPLMFLFMFRVFPLSWEAQGWIGIALWFVSVSALVRISTFVRDERRRTFSSVVQDLVEGLEDGSIVLDHSPDEEIVDPIEFAWSKHKQRIQDAAKNYLENTTGDNQ